ncbi:MAG: hypothetical protein Q7V56_12660 [Gammaproteobacteria bacterium]|nr:hypothetical protein [Gammaproteobacteria bacterium]
MEHTELLDDAATVANASALLKRCPTKTANKKKPLQNAGIL